MKNTMKKLKEMLEQKGLEKKGRAKKDLVDRLLEAAEAGDAPNVYVEEVPTERIEVEEREHAGRRSSEHGRDSNDSLRKDLPERWNAFAANGVDRISFRGSSRN